MMLVILFSLRTIELLQIGVATHFQVTPLFSMRTELLASLQSCCNVDAAWCKWALILWSVNCFGVESEYHGSKLFTGRSSCLAWTISFGNQKQYYHNPEVRKSKMAGKGSYSDIRTDLESPGNSSVLSMVNVHTENFYFWNCWASVDQCFRFFSRFNHSPVSAQT